MSSETAGVQAWINAQNAINIAARLANAELLLKQQAAIISAIVPPTVPTPAPLPQVLWHAGMETGNLSEWAVQNNNTGSALSSAVQALAEGIPQLVTPWVMKQAVGTNGSATRMGATSIIPQVKSGTPFWVTWWDYYPQPILFGAQDQFMIFQIAGFDGVNYSPVWAIYLNGADGTIIVIWSPNSMAPAEGPHAGEGGKRVYTTTIPVPIGKWTKFELYVDASQNFLGALQLYMDGVKLFDQSLIKTRYPGTGDAGQPGFMYIEHTAYGAPGTHYIDDVTYSLGRMP